MIFPDEHSEDLEKLLDIESEEDKLALLEVDLPLTDVFLSLDTCGITFESDVDRFLVAQHIRVAYITGHKNGVNTAKQFFGPLVGKLGNKLMEEADVR